MEKWVGKVALVTGANSGIGLATTKQLLELGLKVVALDLNSDQLKILGDEADLHYLRTDLSHEEEITRAFQWTENNLGGLDLLVNNAGIGGVTNLLDGKMDEWRKMVDVNLLAHSFCASEAIALMRKTKTEHGQVINITSHLAHLVPVNAPFLHFYAATKHAAQAVSEGLRQELQALNIPIRISTITPGLVKTNIFKSSTGTKMDSIIYNGHPSLTPEDVAESIRYIISTPTHVAINEISIRPAGSVN